MQWFGRENQWRKGWKKKRSLLYRVLIHVSILLIGDDRPGWTSISTECLTKVTCEVTSIYDTKIKMWETWKRRIKKIFADSILFTNRHLKKICLMVSKRMTSERNKIKEKRSWFKSILGSNPTSSLKCKWNFVTSHFLETTFLFLNTKLL